MGSGGGGVTLTGGAGGSGLLSTFLLCPEITLLMFGIQEYDILIVFLLNVVAKVCPGGKLLSTSWRNFLPMFVSTLQE